MDLFTLFVKRSRSFRFQICWRQIPFSGRFNWFVDFNNSCKFPRFLKEDFARFSLKANSSNKLQGCRKGLITIITTIDPYLRGRDRDNDDDDGFFFYLWTAGCTLYNLILILRIEKLQSNNCSDLQYRERERERCNKVCNASIPNIKLLFLTEHPKVSGPAPPRPPPWGRWPHPRWEQGCLPASSRRSSSPRGRGQTELEPKFVTFAKKTFLECFVLVSCNQQSLTMIYKLNMIQFLSLLCLTKEIAQIAATTLVVGVADSTPSGCRDHTNLLLALGGFCSSGCGLFWSHIFTKWDKSTPGQFKSNVITLGLLTVRQD